MARTKTTLPVDDEVLAAVRAQSLRSGRPEYEVVEEALRRHLADDGEGLDDIVRRIQTHGDLDETQIVDLAYSGLRTMRAGGQSRRER